MTEDIRDREALTALLRRLAAEQAVLDEMGEEKVARDLNVAIENLCARLGIASDTLGRRN